MLSALNVMGFLAPDDSATRCFGVCFAFVDGRPMTDTKCRHDKVWPSMLGVSPSDYQSRSLTKPLRRGQLTKQSAVIPIGVVLLFVHIYQSDVNRRNAVS